jgi:gamma-glutamylcyclotransferase
METFQYFAYGSNMLLRRLQSRTPSATVIGTGFVAGRRLAFHKVGRDGSGKCDMVATGRASDRVYGVLFRIPCIEKAGLDSAEGLGQGYTEECVPVQRGDGTSSAATAYLAIAVDPALRPFTWYQALVVSGAVENGLPSAYVEWLRTFPARPDPDAERRMEYEELLSRVARG